MKKAVPNLVASQKIENYSFIFLACLMAFFLIRYQIRLFDYFQWDDESETIVTAKMMAHGYRLYSEVFNNHGPLVFLPGMVLEWFGWFQIKQHRIVIALMQWVAFGAIFFSPLLKNTDKYLKLVYVFLAGTITVVYFPFLSFSHTYTYQVVAALFLVVVLAQYGLPIICDSSQVSKRAVVTGNLLLVCLPFLALNFAPPALILFFAFFKPTRIKETLLGVLIGLALNFAFIALFSSFPGWYAIHYYVSVEIMSPLRGEVASIPGFLLTIQRSLTQEIPSFLAIVVMVASISRLSLSEKGFPYRTSLLFIGLISLLIRGTGVQGPPFYFACLTLPIVFFSGLNTVNKKYYIFIVPLLILCITKLLLIFWFDKYELEKRRIASTSHFSELVQKLTNKDDRILVYTYHNEEYIKADRLPASGNHHYFVWQEKYNRNPILGISIDTCKEIANNPPKLIMTDMWSPVDSHPWASYSQCIQGVLNQKYTQVKNNPIWIRDDIFPDYLEKQPKN
ncbi:hypothetical protein MCEZE4_01171 [Burkholderiaceae bacterium]